ncbi:hypothetical protein COW53_02575 [bacterium CG17_big_fil_post_rev_8_21_14_2_50_64_8]|nr:MAG: hypothetical protein COW53_02575 [bacterium CG17_big_fil_post_rev_8_21_14_2_50_64_8]
MSFHFPQDGVQRKQGLALSAQFSRTREVSPQGIGPSRFDPALRQVRPGPQGRLRLVAGLFRTIAPTKTRQHEVGLVQFGVAGRDGHGSVTQAPSRFGLAFGHKLGGELGQQHRVLGSVMHFPAQQLPVSSRPPQVPPGTFEMPIMMDANIEFNFFIISTCR